MFQNIQLVYFKNFEPHYKLQNGEIVSAKRLFLVAESNWSWLGSGGDCKISERSKYWIVVLA